MKRLAPALAFLLLLACAPELAPQAALERANREFAGRDVNEFFISYGAAAGSRQEGAGTVYRWLSLEPHGGQRPAEIETYPGGHMGEIGGNGEMISGYCEISIRTDSAGRIRKLTLVYDSTGKYSGSRCAEIFSSPPP